MQLLASRTTLGPRRATRTDQKTIEEPRTLLGIWTTCTAEANAEGTGLGPVQE